jgi:parallel beta-helix repeat protein
MLNRRSVITGATTLVGAVLGGSTPELSAGLPSGDSPRSMHRNILDFGAIPDGQTMNTAAFARASKACAEAGGGIIEVPAGHYLSGPIVLGSNTILYLAPGAMLKGSPKLEDYPVEANAVSGESKRSGFVTARDAENVALLGRGIIDGNSLPFHDLNKLHRGSDWEAQYTRQKSDYMNPKYGTETGPLAHGERPGNLVRFINCRKVLLQGITVQNSPTWTMLFHGCDDVNIDGLNINSHASGRRVPNDDGMDLRSSSNIRISNCNIQTGDDCIAVFGSQNLVVSNCTLASRSSGVRVGYTSGDSRNLIFQNLAIDSNCGLKINVRGTGTVEDVLFSNIVMHTGLITGHWWGKGEPFNISAQPLHDPEDPGKLGKLRRIRLSNILAESENSAIVHGSPDCRIEDVLMENFQLKMRNSRLQPRYGGNFDLRAAADPTRGLFEHDIPGLFFSHVERFRIHGFCLCWEEIVPDFFSHAIEGENFRDLEIQGFEGRQAKAGAGTAILLRDGSGISIRDCRAASGTGTFLSMKNVSDQRLLVNNELGQAQKASDPAKTEFTASGNLLPQ